MGILISLVFSYLCLTLIGYSVTCINDENDTPIFIQAGLILAVLILLIGMLGGLGVALGGIARTMGVL
jgi:hypothetical protein